MTPSTCYSRRRFLITFALALPATLLTSAFTVPEYDLTDDPQDQPQDPPPPPPPPPENPPPAPTAPPPTSTNEGD